MNFAIDIRRTSGIAMELERERQNLESCRNTVLSVIRGNSFSGSARQRVIRSLNIILEEMENERRSLLQMENCLYQVGEIYSRYEEKISRCESGTSIQWGNGQESAAIGEVVISNHSERENEEKESVWSWDDTWNMISKVGIAGGIISTIGGAVTGERSIMEFLKGLTSVIGDVVSAQDKETDVLWKYIVGATNGLEDLDISSFKNTFASYVKKDLYTDLKFETGAKVTNKIQVVSKWVGHILTLVTNGMDNYDEYHEKKENGFTVGRAVAETVYESGMDILLGVGATAAVSGIAGMLVTAGAIASAPAVAIGIGAAGVVWAANGICKWATGGRDIGEVVADSVCDYWEDAVEKTKNNIKKAVDGVSTVWHTMCNIFQ